MFECLKRMHAAIHFTVKENGVLGEPFRVESGVKQGDPLSPLLFGLFIDRLEAFLSKECPEIGVSIVSAFLRALLYADDLALMALGRKDLQNLLDALFRFSEVNHLTVNIAKCKCVVFNKSSRQSVTQFTYNGQGIDNADWFDYLGTRFYRSFKQTAGHIKQNMSLRIGKAEQAFILMRRRCGELDIHSAALRSNLFNALVSSVLASGSEVWGLYHLRGWLSGDQEWGMRCTPERLHRRFLRWAFGSLPQSVDGTVLLIEAGRAPLVHSWVKQLLTFYNRAVKRTAGDIVQQCVSESIASLNGGTWGRCFVSLVRVIHSPSADQIERLQLVDVVSVLSGLQSRWQASWPSTDPLRDVALRAVEQSEGFKFITYCKWFRPASDAKEHMWIYHVLSALEVRTLAAFRMSAHKLNIEALRHRQVPRQNRVCPLCRTPEQACLEDELHVFECPHYGSLRAKYDFQPVAGSADEFMRRAMTHGARTQDWRRLATFLIAVFAHRENLLKGPTTHPSP
jgi:hypothetical protein